MIAGPHPAGPRVDYCLDRGSRGAIDGTFAEVANSNGAGGPFEQLVLIRPVIAQVGRRGVGPFQSVELGAAQLRADRPCVVPSKHLSLASTAWPTGLRASRQ
jgi:hypothetical protein